MKKHLITGLIIALAFIVFGVFIKQTNNFSNSENSTNDEINQEVLAVLDKFWELSLENNKEELKNIIAKTPEHNSSFVSLIEHSHEKQNKDEKKLFQMNVNSLSSSEIESNRMFIDTISAEIKRTNLVLKQVMSAKVVGDNAVVWLKYGEKETMMLHQNSFFLCKTDGFWKLYAIKI